MAPGQGLGCTGWMDGLQCQPGPEQRNMVCPCRDLVLSWYFFQQNYCKMGLWWLWGSCEIHLSSLKENGSSLLWRTGPWQLFSGSGNSSVSYLNSLGSAVIPLLHFLLSKSKAAGNHLLYSCKRWSHASCIPSPNWAVLVPSYHISATSLWLSVDPSSSKWL